MPPLCAPIQAIRQCGSQDAYELLSALPAETGMAFVLVQHLDPDHPSLLTTLLTRTTTMPVEEVHDGVLVEPNTST